MNKLLEVREFDTITCNVDYRDDDNYKYLDEKTFQELVKFTHEFAGDKENADALEFMRIGYKRNIGDVVSINN
jgi:5-methylcytosine-specific restriction enzyme subunit McrC